MKIWKDVALSAIGALLLLPCGLQAQAGGKVFARVGGWEVKKFPKYCVATIGFDGDRALRLSSGADSFSFGFMGENTALAPAKTQVVYWFDNNKQAKQTRTFTKRSSQAEDGGAAWIIAIDPASEPSHAGDFELSRSVTFTYRINGTASTETFTIKNGGAAYGKLFQCSGQ